MKKSISVLLAAMLLLCGCGNAKPNADESVTLTMWHVYGSQTESPLNDAVEEFNETVGMENGIYINITSVTDSAEIDEMLEATLQKQPGALSLPDLFTAYPRVADKFAEGQLLDWSQYFSEEELAAYHADFLSEGYFGEKLLMLPIAKSSELLFVNQTLFDKFSAATGITMDCFADMESLLAACDAYYDWSGGGTMFQINDFYHYFLANMAAMGEEFIQDGKIRADSPAFAAALAPVAKAGIYGGLCVGDGYASDRWKTGEVISNIGSTAGILYLRDYVTYPDNSTEDIETIVLPYPCLADGAPTVVQRGGGLFAVKNADEKKNEAIALFAKWITDEEHNLDFVTKAGYLPVKDDAFEAIFADLEKVENEKYRLLYAAVGEQYAGGYQFCSVPFFAGASDTQRDFEKLMKSTLASAHRDYLSRTASGEDAALVMDELNAAVFKVVREALR